jgi:large subunit ribosomal protein L17
MRHRNDHRRLGRNASHRKAMLRNLVTSLLDHEQIRTTDAKAKEVRRIAERMITLGKKGDLSARRRALRTVRSREVAAKVFGPLATRFRERAGGYTRILKLGRRPGDNAEISLIQLLPDETSAGQTPSA